MQLSSLIVIPVLGDNFTYLLHDNAKAVVIDPSEANPVLSHLSKHSLQLQYILNTHAHFDHVGGNHQLKKETGCIIYGTDRCQTPDIDTVVEDGDVIAFGSFSFTVVATPGHTPDSVSYYCTHAESDTKMLFTGDTLFCGGCGRLMGCEPAVMWDSLTRLMSFDGDTLIYPGHDYTDENYQFAASIDEPLFVHDYRLKLLNKTATIPTTVHEEKEYNIFLRNKDSRIRAALAMPDASDSLIFAKLRSMKNSF